MNDRVVLITGGAGNLGRSVTAAFLESGAQVAVPVYKTDQQGALDELQSRYGDQLMSFALDLTTERGAEAVVRQVLEWRGRLDSVIHLVGGYSGGVRIAETPIELWERMIDLNLRSSWLVARSAIPALREAGGGSLVFVSARAALQQRAGHAAYAVSKSALLTLVQAIAEEYGAEGIRANAVLPGTVDTEANRLASPEAEHALWTAPAEIARVILFLASGAASPVNGAAIPVYGRS